MRGWRDLPCETRAFRRLALAGVAAAVALTVWQAAGARAAEETPPAAKPERFVRLAVAAERPNVVAFPAARAKFVRFVVRASAGGQPCIDELEVYAPEGKQNLALGKDGAKASASSCLAGYAIHQVAHLNDGRYGNACSWIAATGGEEWAQIELPQAAEVAKVVFSRDREGQVPRPFARRFRGPAFARRPAMDDRRQGAGTRMAGRERAASRGFRCRNR